jgi:hypothetical protein
VEVLSELSSLILGVIGGSGATVAAIYFLSNWLGKVWAARMLEADRHRYATELERLKAETQAELAIYREKYLGMHRDKIELYRAAAIPIIELVTEVLHGQLTSEFVAAYDRRRLEVRAHLALFAPQDVLDAYDALIDYTFDVLDQHQRPDWGTFRILGFALINRMRADIGMSIGDVTYQGRR